MTWLDVWDMFCEEYSRYAKERQSKYKCPSHDCQTRDGESGINRCYQIYQSYQLSQIYHF